VNQNGGRGGVVVAFLRVQKGRWLLDVQPSSLMHAPGSGAESGIFRLSGSSQRSYAEAFALSPRTLASVKWLARRPPNSGPQQTPVSRSLGRRS
jgi:hypothetical protein